MSHPESVVIAGGINEDDCEFTVESLKRKFYKQELSNILCILNIWETPKALGIGRKLRHKELRPLFEMVLSLVSHNEFLKNWNSADRRDLWNDPKYWEKE